MTPQKRAQSWLAYALGRAAQRGRRNPGLAEDYRSAVGLALWLASQSYRAEANRAGESGFRRYLDRALHHAFLEEERRHRLRNRAYRLLARSEASYDGGPARTEACDFWTARRGRLTPKQAMVLNAIFWQGERVAVVANRVGVQVHSIRSACHRAWERLRLES